MYTVHCFVISVCFCIKISILHKILHGCDILLHWLCFPGHNYSSAYILCIYIYVNCIEARVIIYGIVIVGLSAHQAWPPGCCLKFVGGTRMSEYDRVMVDALPPSTATEVIVVLTSPADLGSYRGEWRMSTISGFYFGGM